MPDPHGRYTLTKVTLERKGEVGPGVSVRRWMKPGTEISSEMSKEEAKRRLMRMSVPRDGRKTGSGWSRRGSRDPSEGKVKGAAAFLRVERGCSGASAMRLLDKENIAAVAERDEICE